MRYIFYGTPDFARIVLEKLLDQGLIPVALIANPDRPSGRKKILTPPATKKLLRERGVNVPILQPEKLASIKDDIRSLKPDVAVVAAYAKIIPGDMLALPIKGTVGVHPSLLPKYRGTTPIQSAILDGEAQTGTTIYLLDKGIDEGPIIAARGTSAAGKSYSELHDELATLGGELLTENLPAFINGDIVPQEQDYARATLTKKFINSDAYVEPEILAAALSGKSPQKASKIYRLILALNPEPGVWTEKDGRRLKLLKADLVGNTLKLRETQFAGEKPRRLN